MKNSLYALVAGGALLTLILIAMGVGGPMGWTLISVLIWALGPYVLALPLVHFAPSNKLHLPILPALLLVCVGGVLFLLMVFARSWDPFWIIWIPFVQWLLLAATTAMIWGNRVWNK